VEVSDSRVVIDKATDRDNSVEVAVNSSVAVVSLRGNRTPDKLNPVEGVYPAEDKECNPEDFDRGNLRPHRGECRLLDQEDNPVPVVP
jgi:hypothetical protein